MNIYSFQGYEGSQVPDVELYSLHVINPTCSEYNSQRQEIGYG